MNTNDRLIIAETYGTDLSSRSAGSRLRRDIEAISSRSVLATLDFTDVRTVSHSFADEAIAVLIAKRGPEWFKVNARIVGASFSIRETILEAIDARLSLRTDLCSF